MNKINTFFSIALLLFLGACTNLSTLKSKSTTTTTNPAYLSGSGIFTHVLQNVNITPLTTGSPPDLMLSLATAPGVLPLTQYCQVGGSSTSPCVCVLTWTELNTIGGNTVTLPRTKKLAVSQVQTSLVKCQMTQSFWNEIPAGTSMHMNIEPISPNVSGLTVQKIGYKKGTSIAPAGDFVDDTLTPFRNIFHYSCFSKRDASFEVLNGFTQSQIQTGAGSTQNVNVILASRFCVAGDSNCQTPRRGFTAQSYYRNLYVRSDKTGEINSMNARYDCPRVFESINYRATSTPSVPAPEQNKYWPMDSTFAVATSLSSEWSVPIPAASVLMKNGDASAVDDAGIRPVDRLQELGTSNGGIAWKLMGYGKKPNSDGTCGSIVDGNGQTRPLTRLRRYRVIYPSTFQDSGQVAQERPEADQVYIPDRLVVDVNGSHTGNMIYGPKPCNFSWFDHEGVTKRNGSFNFQVSVPPSASGGYPVPNYRSTMDYYYDPSSSAGDEIYVNPDGRILPNLDRDGAIGGLIGPSCSSSVPVYEYSMGIPTKVRLVTSYLKRTDWVTLGTRKFFMKEIHLSPIEPWFPNYVEDTSFKACVPISDVYREPPLHFYRENASGGKVAWCSKVYPTQNTYWLDLNTRKKPLGTAISARAINWPNSAPVEWYTSHIHSSLGLDTHNVNPTCSSTKAEKICEWSLQGGTGDPDYTKCVQYLNQNLVTNGTFDNRCDRTVMFDPNLENRGFPLQARDSEIQTMLKNDLAKQQSFACNYSVHVNPALIDKVQPLTNCCGVKNGTPILDEASLKLVPNTPANQGHLEPYFDPAYPNVRYCGNPVE